MMFFRITFLVFIFSFPMLHAQERNIENENLCELKDSTQILRIIEEQPDSVEGWVGDKIYLASYRIAITRRGAYLCNRESRILLPAFALDQNGIFIRCKQKDVGPEAQAHYDRAKEAFLDALGHSAAAGAAIADLPPVGIYEGYKAVQAWKEAAREYNAGVECEQRGTYCPPEQKSSRDD